VQSDELPELASYLRSFGDPSGEVVERARTRLELARGALPGSRGAGGTEPGSHGSPGSPGARRAGVRRASAVVLVAAALVVALVLPLSLRHGPALARGGRRPTSASRSGALRGSDTTLVVWPGTTCCDASDTVSVADLASGSVTVRPVPPISGGDLPTPLVAVGAWLVYEGEAADPGVFALPGDLAGPPRLLGQAAWFVPGAGGEVVLVSNPFAPSGATARPVNVSNGRAGRPILLPPGTTLLRGTARGLLLASANSLVLLRDGMVTRLAELSSPSADYVGSDEAIVAFATGCRWAEADGLAASPVTTRLCGTLHVIDLATGHEQSFPAPPGSLGWEPQGSLGGVGVVAPGDRMIAAEAALPEAAAGRGRLYLLRLGADSARAVAVSGGEVPLSAPTAWSRRGSWLLFEGLGGHLLAYQATTGRTVTLPVRASRNGVDAMASVPAS
jgi:hypothetical protein